MSIHSHENYCKKHSLFIIFFFINDLTHALTHSQKEEKRLILHMYADWLVADECDGERWSTGHLVYATEHDRFLGRGCLHGLCHASCVCLEMQKKKNGMHERTEKVYLK